MENEEIRLQALRVLNQHFKYEGKSGCLEDRQVKLVLDAMIEFRQFVVIKSVCTCTAPDVAMEDNYCGKCGLPLK